MKPNELMIANWVIDNGKYAQITGITCDGNIETTVNEKSNIELIEPIPLTTEILKRNGFIKSNGEPGIHAECYELCNHKEKYHLTIADYNKYKRLLLHIDSEDAECFNIRCDYIHNLQNALALCGIKKRIEL